MLISAQPCTLATVATCAGSPRSHGDVLRIRTNAIATRIHSLMAVHTAANTHLHKCLPTSRSGMTFVSLWSGLNVVHVIVQLIAIERGVAPIHDDDDVDSLARIHVAHTAIGAVMYESKLYEQARAASEWGACIDRRRAQIRSAPDVAHQFIKLSTAAASCRR